MSKFTLVLAVILYATLSLTSPLVRAKPTGDEECAEGFPRSFYVSTGTTIPSSDTGAPIAQSGNIFVSEELGQVRMDQFHLGRQHTFITDRRKRRAYMFERQPASETGPRNVECHVFATVGDATALCIPTGFTHDTATTHEVRGVRVERFYGFDRQDGPLLQIDHFVLNATLSDISGAVKTHTLVPWRMQTRERPGAELRGITGAPLSMPNWRFFGQPMFDEVDFPLRGQGAEGVREVTPWVAESGPVTVDFYNYVPGSPDPAVFAVPQACKQAEEAWEASSKDPPAARGADDGGVASTTGADSLLRLTMAHRLLIDWSVAVSRQAAAQGA